VEFSEQKLNKVNEIIARYPQGKSKSALIPLLLMAQEEWGWLSTDAMDYVAEILAIKPIEVYEVATFYSMFHLKPVGKNFF
jgi:NADH-quinone oxidoreductase subunit E